MMKSYFSQMIQRLQIGDFTEILEYFLEQPIFLAYLKTCPYEKTLL